MGVQFKYITPGSQKQSCCVEWKFATLLDKIYTMINSGKFVLFLRKGLCADAANTSTLLENNLHVPVRDVSLFQKKLGREREIS